MGLCDALFRAEKVLREDDEVLIGLPDTVWFPVGGFSLLPSGEFSFLLFPVDNPRRFDAVVTRGQDVIEVQVKAEHPDTHWVWGAFRMPASVFRSLYELWLEPGRGDEYVGTLVNEYLKRGGRALGIAAGERYFDVGTVDGYRAAIDALRPPLVTAGRAAD
jgi:dTDP-glucose pyrophosphorylase